MTRLIDRWKAQDIISCIPSDFGCIRRSDVNDLCMDVINDIAEIHRLRTALQAIANNAENCAPDACKQMEHIAREALEAQA